MGTHYRRFHREFMGSALSAAFNFCRFTVGAVGAVGDLYQAKSNAVREITRDSAGNYTVQFNLPFPAAIQYVDAQVCPALSSDAPVDLKYVPGSYDNVEGTMQLRAGVETTDGVAATGTITLVANADMTDGDYITIDDGYGTPVLYEYDKAGDGVTAGRVAVTVGGASTDAEVAARFKVAIDANQPLLSVVDNEDGTLTVTHTVVGTVGNNAMTENATNAGVLVSGLSGGVDAVGATVELPEDAEVQLMVVELRQASADVASE